jgi:hypothetical protein
MIRRICIECDHRWTGGLNCPECGAPGEPLPLDWPAIVFPGPEPGQRVARCKYRAGALPSGRKMREWSERYGLRFVVDADGVRAEKLPEDVWPRDA